MLVFPISRKNYNLLEKAGNPYLIENKTVLCKKKPMTRKYVINFLSKFCNGIEETTEPSKMSSDGNELINIVLTTDVDTFNEHMDLSRLSRPDKFKSDIAEFVKWIYRNAVFNVDGNNNDDDIINSNSNSLIRQYGHLIKIWMEFEHTKFYRQIYSRIEEASLREIQHFVIHHLISPNFVKTLVWYYYHDDNDDILSDEISSSFSEGSIVNAFIKKFNFVLLG